MVDVGVCGCVRGVSACMGGHIELQVVSSRSRVTGTSATHSVIMTCP